ncbi:MAG: LysM peptidoglycan-binding domain-containing protein [Chloroflexi bacterium]|nr:LysM peptidoglycan-binding domain-containing protein [Chloroflexota bacterium]
MKNRPWLLVIIVALVLLSLILAGCERDRPAPAPAQATTTPKGTTAPAARGTTSPTPPAVQTKVSLPAAGSQTPAALAPAGAATTIPPARLTPPTPAPPTSKPPAALTPAPQGSQTGSDKWFPYTVKVGDTLGEIADTFKTTPQAILALNPLADPDLLMAGKELKIPGELPVEMGGLRTYTVQHGDTLSGIAARYTVALSELMKLNNIADADAIYPGQQLRIPGSTAVVPTPGQPRTYTVQRGDTLFSVATRFGVTVWALQVANNISNPNAIYVGQELKIP